MQWEVSGRRKEKERTKETRPDIPETPRKNLVNNSPLKSFARAVIALTTAHNAMQPAIYHDGLTRVRIISVNAAHQHRKANKNNHTYY
jgi:hypothetical protein